MPPSRDEILALRATWYLSCFIGIPYRWGGDDPLAGFDCSGLIVEILQAIGKIPYNSDFTADELYRRYLTSQTTEPKTGCLSFWLFSGRATHVEMFLDNHHTVGASGGGQATNTLENAIAQNAYIKMRPLGYRGSNYVICDPFLI